MKKLLPIFLATAWAFGDSGAAEPAANRPSAERLAHACSGCHGTYGHALPPTPSLAGLPEDSFVSSMAEFKSGGRTSSAMNRIAKGYTEQDIKSMAQFFNKQ